jgi:ureidoglycolate dehydrogenase (NAD+)
VAASGAVAARSIDADVLARWGHDCLVAVGVPTADAAIVAGALVQTSLWGIDSHGVARLGHYLARIRAGSVAAKPALRMHRTGPCTAQMDGGHGLGIVVCMAAMDEAIAMAQQSGVGVVGISESSHCGAIGLYSRRAAASGLIGFAFTHANSVVVPFGGITKWLGTNPISIAFPNPQGGAICLDMATSSIPWNRVLNARREGQTLPVGVVVDAHGETTRDADAAAALLPLGGNEYGHKGYALALMIDLLCGPLNGMPAADRITPMYGDLNAQRHLGSLVMALDPMRFAGGPRLADSVRELIGAMRSQPGHVQHPGEPEERSEAARRCSGIPIEEGLWAEFDEWSQTLGVPLPETR